MSGVEVSGLILAVLPLFISALEDYKDGLDPLKLFYSWDSQLPKHIRRLRDQHIHYQQTLQLLLDPVAPPEEVERLIESPGGEAWREPDVQEILRERLGKTYSTYEETMSDIGKTMMKIAKDLGMDKDLNFATAHVKPTCVELEALLQANPWKDGKFQFRRRVKFGMGHKKLKKRLDNLDRDIKELQRWTDSQDRLEPYQTDFFSAFALPLERLRDYANKLHCVLRSLAWECNCQQLHQTRLKLEHRLAKSKVELRKQKKEIETKGARFSMAISMDEVEWQAAEIRILTDEHLKVHTAPCPINNLHRSVQFVSPPNVVVAQQTTIMSPETWQEYDNLCSAFQRIQISCQCLGFYLDPQSKLRGHYPVDNVTISNRGNTISLEQLLSNPPLVNGRATKLTKEERMALAVTLASTILQLQMTPWMRETWEKEDILFDQTTAGARPVEIEDSFVIHTFPSHQYIASTTQDHVPQTNNGCISLLSLGLILIELYTGRPIVHPSISQDISSNGPISPMGILAEKLKEERDELSRAYERAVGQCLKSYIDSLQSNVQDADLREAIFAGIVQPLQTELLQFRGEDPRAWKF